MEDGLGIRLVELDSSKRWPCPIRYYNGELQLSALMKKRTREAEDNQPADIYYCETVNPLSIISTPLFPDVGC